MQRRSSQSPFHCYLMWIEQIQLQHLSNRKGEHYLGGTSPMERTHSGRIMCCLQYCTGGEIRQHITKSFQMKSRKYKKLSQRICWVGLPRLTMTKNRDGIARDMSFIASLRSDRLHCDRQTSLRLLDITTLRTGDITASRQASSRSDRLHYGVETDFLTKRTALHSDILHYNILHAFTSLHSESQTNVRYPRKTLKENVGPDPQTEIFLWHVCSAHPLDSGDPQLPCLRIQAHDRLQVEYVAVRLLLHQEHLQQLQHTHTHTHTAHSRWASSFKRRDACVTKFI
jgi:hypothetical protein